MARVLRELSPTMPPSTVGTSTAPRPSASYVCRRVDGDWIVPALVAHPADVDALNG